jgi:hypothetical protein
MAPFLGHESPIKIIALVFFEFSREISCRSVYQRRPVLIRTYCSTRFFPIFCWFCKKLGKILEHLDAAISSFRCRRRFGEGPRSMP